jgi:anti-sigma B factor antagonist
MIDQEGIKIDIKVIDYESRLAMVTVSGYVDQANCHLLQQTIGKCLDDKYYHVVFDLQKLVYMSSAGWGVLIGEIKRFRENGGDIKLANMGPEIYEIYQMLEFYHIISEYPSIEDALKSFNVKSIGHSEEPAVAKEFTEEESAGREKAIDEGEEAAADVGVEEGSTPEAEETLAEELAPETEETPAEEELEEEPEPEEIIEDGANAKSAVSEEDENSVSEDVSPEEKPADEEKKSIFEEPIRKEDFIKLSTSDKQSEITDEAHPLEEEEQGEIETGPEEKETNIQVSKKESKYRENSKGTSDDNSKIISEDEIDINIEGILADEGISISSSSPSGLNYVEFDPEKYTRRVDIKMMPVPDKIREIVAHNPELNPLQIRKMLNHPDYGGVNIGYLKLKSLLKSLELDTKEKRYRFYRSS